MYIYIYVYVYVNEYLHMNMYANMHVCMFVYMCTYMYIHTYTRIHKYMCINITYLYVSFGGPLKGPLPTPTPRATAAAGRPWRSRAWTSTRRPRSREPQLDQRLRREAVPEDRV